MLGPVSEFAGVSVADPTDIACMKVSAIASRGTKRDFIDLYELAKRESLGTLLGNFQRKFAQATQAKSRLSLGPRNSGSPKHSSVKAGSRSEVRSRTLWNWKWIYQTELPHCWYFQPGGFRELFLRAGYRVQDIDTGRDIRIFASPKQATEEWAGRFDPWEGRHVNSA